ncbi:hypothetical protein MMC26_001806 [Xylographa opegraphella]|nr:hypothetical protein [Xylographa opegraphella]
MKVRARCLDNDAENEKYMFPLDSKERKPSGAPAIVPILKDFKQNFDLFSESSLVDLDWNNVVAAEGSRKILPSNSSIPSSDVDLFIYGLDASAALEKIKHIETHIRNSILAKTTTIRTKNAISIASQYPVRHVQIIARLYKSISEIFTGFDVDCSCFAYDGSQVYGAPRAIAAFITQTNIIDLSRRSQSYESRLSNYSRRRFEGYWPLLKRDRIPLQFLKGRSLEPWYLIQRRFERGRPALPSYYDQSLSGNMKDQEPDGVAKWIYEDEIANYHALTIPYGPRTISLHRHPCLIGNANSVVHDFCGTCPQPATEEERAAALEESKIYVSGYIEFMKDDPGRQTIGSFNPSTDNEWTDMAYIGNTTELCQAICAGDLQFVKERCMQESSIPDRRDTTGRILLQLGVECSSPEIDSSMPYR